MTSFFIPGLPQPQGSAKAFVVAGRARITTDNKRVYSWRVDVKSRAQDHFAAPLLGPVVVAATFYLPRPQGHYGSGRNAGCVRASAPTAPAVKPDVDKLSRALLDALTGVAYRDDAQVVTLIVAKDFADGHPMGTEISVRAWDDCGPIGGRA